MWKSNPSSRTLPYVVGMPTGFLVCVTKNSVNLKCKTDDVMDILFEAIRNKDLTQLLALLNQGADANARDEYGYTPLTWAVDCGDLAIVTNLLKRGADVNMPGFMSRVPLMSVIFSMSAEKASMMRILLDHGATLDARTQRDNQSYGGMTALMFAVQIASLEMVLLLVEAGADVNASEEGGTSVLMWATRYLPEATGIDQAERPAVVAYLLQHGADVNAKSKEEGGNLTALDFARQNNRKDIEQLLLQAGAKTGQELDAEAKH